ncbi:tetratricopeptide repeat protein 39C-like [Amphiura filiformis]|uniref:tetratricopeptide repeat protein 39C-like n=1 Tax=Amphiura filiformis TaxID=82378 RepID=UPI003B216B1C
MASSAVGKPASNGAEDGIDSAGEAIDDVAMSLQGIDLLLNNGFKQSQAIFEKYRDYSPLMSAGSSFVTFMNAMMTFEDEKLDGAVESLKETEKLCNLESGNIVKSFKSKVFRKDSKTGNTVLSTEERIQRQIILADCQLYMAMLVMIRQEVTGYIKGGLLIRKGYKMYEKVYKEIGKVYKIRGQELGDELPSSPTDDNSEASSEDGVANHLSDEKVISPGDYSDLSDADLARLRGGASFGYGLLQLIISMMPPNLLKVVNLFGFKGNRRFGLQCLHLASHSTDMKAPLAMLSLLWYHTVVRPFFGLDDKSTTSCVTEATAILEENEPKYPNSSLVMFYRGRVLKIQCKIEEALSVYNLALEAAADQREIQLICVYEIGWCNLMKFYWEDSMLAFARLKEESKWSQSYYAYLTGMCQGALGQVETAQEMFREVPQISKRKNEQLEKFLIRKSQKFKKKVPTKAQCALLAIEVLYLWRALPTCKEEHLTLMLSECEAEVEKSWKALRSLLKGAILRNLDSRDAAIQCFEDALAYSSAKDQEPHVGPYTCFELGSMLMEKPATASKGKSLVIRAKDHYKDYDFEQRLNVRIHALLSRNKDIQ